MISENTITEIKEHLQEYLEEKGINTKRPFNCLNPQHADNNPSMSYDPKRNIVKCFSCDASYDLISLYALDNNLDTKTDFRKIIENLTLKYNINYNTPTQITTSFLNAKKSETKEDYTKYYNKCKKNIRSTDYLTKRGISEALQDKYNIGYDETEDKIVFPLNASSYISRYINNPYKKHSKQGTNVIFNEDYIKNSDFKSVVWVSEAIIDALSLEEVNENIKAISLNSINNAKQLVELVKSSNYKGMLVLALDTDTNGIRASKELKEDLEALGIASVIYNSRQDRFNIDERTKIKDINELLLADKEKLKKDVDYIDASLKQSLEAKALKVYQQENVFNYLDEFIENIKDNENNKPLSTGINTLDRALEGGFYRKNLVIIGAISSLGKTTLALQIADNIAKQKQDVLIFSLEMAKEELIAKSLSRLSYLKAYNKHYTAIALTTREILTRKCLNDTLANKDRYNLFTEALADYKENMAQNIYITECDENLDINLKTISEKIKNHIAITNNKPFVVIDYLQIIQNQEKGLTDKQAIDKIVVALKRIARENDITILLVSAFNRASYNQESNLASFRDSSTIEYTADVLLALQHKALDNITTDKADATKINQEQQKDERELTLKVLKNRNGRISDIEHIIFYAKYNYMNFKDYDK